MNVFVLLSKHLGTLRISSYTGGQFLCFSIDFVVFHDETYEKMTHTFLIRYK